MNVETRNLLRVYIEQCAIAFSVARVDHDEIDRINILKASFKAMHLALDALKIKPKLLLIDGNRFTRYGHTRHVCIIKGDGIYSSIAAASILAKTYRDEYMLGLHSEFLIINGIRIRDTALKNIAKRSVNMDYLHTTGVLFNVYPRNCALKWICN